MKHQVRVIYNPTNKKESVEEFEQELAEALDDGFEIRGFQATDVSKGFGYAYALVVKATQG